jgi:K+-sensing histidine kinase KdpD
VYENFLFIFCDAPFSRCATRLLFLKIGFNKITALETTKPTGQGTGLGLSLSYDIVKAHGGDIKVKTKEGEGAEFVIQLPNTNVDLTNK